MAIQKIEKQRNPLERQGKRIRSAVGSAGLTRKSVLATLPEARKRVYERHYGPLSQGPGAWNEVFVALDVANVPGDFLSKEDRDHRPPARRPAPKALLAEDRSSRGKRK
jgi:hypothetical protein